MAVTRIPKAQLDSTLYSQGGTDVSVADGGTGASTATGARNNLGLGTTDTPQFAHIGIGKAGSAVKVDIFADNDQGVRIENSAASNIAISAYVTGDAQVRFTALGDGKMQWGSGAAVADTNLYRSAADTLKTDDNFVVGAPGTATGCVITTDGAQPVTNKDLKSATNTFATVTSITSSATPTPTGDARQNDLIVTAQAAGATIAAPSGTPVAGNKLLIRIKDNATPQTLAFNAIYRFSTDLPAPTTTVASKTMYIGAIYNGTDSKWDVVLVLGNF